MGNIVLDCRYLYDNNHELLSGIKRMSITLYGIPNCDTVKKARAWLSEHDIDYKFHDYKKSGIDADTLSSWVTEFGWEVVLNKRGRMWRQVPEEIRAKVNTDKAIQLLLETPSMIKRPMLVTGGSRHLGFKPDQYSQIFLVESHV